MSSRRLICFDASIKGNKVGIGVYDSTRKVKLYKCLAKPKGKFGAEDAETMALIASLQYMQENDVPSAHLFTDNINVYNVGINKNMVRKYLGTLGTVELFWIPREFNQTADELSKKGRDVEKIELGELINISDPKSEKKTKTIKMKKTPEEVAQLGLKDRIKEYPIKQRLTLLRRLAMNEYQMRFMYFMLGNPNEIEISESQDDRSFTRVCASIIRRKECPQLDKFCKQFKKRPNVGNAQLKRFVKNRNLI